MGKSAIGMKITRKAYMQKYEMVEDNSDEHLSPRKHLFLRRKKPDSDQPDPDQYDLFNRKIWARYPSDKHKLIAFIGIDEKSGSPEVLTDIAKSLAQNPDRSICILNAHPQKHGLFKIFDRHVNSGLTGLKTSAKTSALISNLHATIWIEKVQPNLYFLDAKTIKTDVNGQLNSAQFELLTNKLRQRFKCVFLDFPPISTHPMIPLLASKTDGVVLVANTGSDLKSNILQNQIDTMMSGVNLIGIVLNDRHAHTIKWVEIPK